MLDELLRKFNLKFDDLSAGERETLFTWVNALQQGQITIEKIKEYLVAMRTSVEQELTTVEHNNKQDIFLKARLRNYLLLEAFLASPEKAKAQMERAVAGIAGK